MGPGIHKLQLPLRGLPLGASALQSALQSRLQQIVVVTNDRAWLPAAVQTERVHIVPCKQAGFGQSRSLSCGIAYAEQLQADGVLIMLADQPFVPAALLNQILETYEQEPEWSYVAVSHCGILQPPVLLSQQLFPLLKGLQGDQGARSVLRHPSIAGRLIACERRDWLYDVDTWEDYIEIRKNV